MTDKKKFKSSTWKKIILSSLFILREKLDDTFQSELGIFSK